jgi:hypothetical protein
MFCLGTSVHNAWKLYRKSEKSKVEPLDYLSFRRHIVNVYLQKYGVHSCSTGRPHSTSKSSKVLSKQIHPSVRFDSSEHWLISANKQNRCAVCSKNSKKMCFKCNLNMYEACFPVFHTDMSSFNVFYIWQYKSDMLKWYCALFVIILLCLWLMWLADMRSCPVFHFWNTSYIS